MKFLDLFAGIGGFRLGLEQSGHECVGHCEIDRHANRSYQAMHNPKEGEWFAEDINTVDAAAMPGVGLWCFGFPCQDISVAGKQGGISANRSGLFFAVMRLLREIEEKNKPGWLLIENVKNLFSVNGGRDFLRVLAELDAVGYDAQWQLINSKDFGVPQNRERVFIVGNLRGRCAGKILPVCGEGGGTLKQIVGGRQGMRVYDPNGLSCTLSTDGGGLGKNTGLYIVPYVIDKDRLRQTTDETAANCIDANYHKGLDNHGQRTAILEAIPCITPDILNKNQNGRWFKEPDDPMFTLTSQDRHGVLLRSADGYRIRRLTPRECFRLQGFPDEYFDRAAAVNSDTQLYKQAGNGVTVTVIRAIGKKFAEYEKAMEE